MLKKFLFLLTAFVTVTLVLGAAKANQIKKLAAAPRTMPPAGVSATAARSEEWRSTLHAIGTLAPVAGMTVAADADGIVTRVAAENGAAVGAGDLLVELDSSVEVAQREAARARAELARVNITRQAELWQRKAIAKIEFDTAIAARKQAEADVAALDAVIAKKQVRAPFAGRAGLRLVNPGQYVGRGAPLLPLQQLDPMYVNFSIPQRHLPDLALGRKVALRVDAFPEAAYAGQITAINATVDAATRNITVQATVANPGERLRAGMFVRVEVELPEPMPVIVVPATAVAYAPYGNSVFIVEKMKTPDGQEYLGVRQQFVEVSVHRGDLVALKGAVKPGEQVVTAGVFKLRNGAPVQVNNANQPAATATPRPANS
jgi:membrane fusion protein (multidrug efflux system)